MAIRFPGAKQILPRSSFSRNEPTPFDVPKGYFPVYVGESQKKRFIVPLSFLSRPEFQELLCKTEEEFGYDHPMGGLTIHCTEKIFMDLTSLLN